MHLIHLQGRVEVVQQPVAGPGHHLSCKVAQMWRLDPTADVDKSLGTALWRIHLLDDLFRRMVEVDQSIAAAGVHHSTKMWWI